MRCGAEQAQHITPHPTNSLDSNRLGADDEEEDTHHHYVPDTRIVHFCPHTSSSRPKWAGVNKYENPLIESWISAMDNGGGGMGGWELKFITGVLLLSLRLLTLPCDAMQCDDSPCFSAMRCEQDLILCSLKLISPFFFSLLRARSSARIRSYECESDINRNVFVGERRR